MTDPACYIERSAVRILLIEAAEINDDVTGSPLAEVDRLPITTFADKDAEIARLRIALEHIAGTKEVFHTRQARGLQAIADLALSADPALSKGESQ